MAAIQPKIYQFRSTLCGFEPEIWRLFEVSANSTVAQLAYTAMVLYEMDASHLFSMLLKEKRRKRAGVRFEFDDDMTEIFVADNKSYNTSYNPAKTKLQQLTITRGREFLLEYDYGDSWVVSMTLKKIYEDPSLKETDLPRVLEGARYGIIEDCGGLYGLERLAQAYSLKSGSDYEYWKDWMGDQDFDIEEFNLEEMNLKLKTKVPKFKKFYENRYL
jgi:hypothetical protein